MPNLKKLPREIKYTTRKVNTYAEVKQMCEFQNHKIRFAHVSVKQFQKSTTGRSAWNRSCGYTVSRVDDNGIDLRSPHEFVSATTGRHRIISRCNRKKGAFIVRRTILQSLTWRYGSSLEYFPRSVDPFRARFVSTVFLYRGTN